jgi:hypothetical protein
MNAQNKKGKYTLHECDEFGHIELLRPHGLQLLERMSGKQLSMGFDRTLRVRKLLEMCIFNTI